jgi:hypothetical protein
MMMFSYKYYSRLSVISLVGYFRPGHSHPDWQLWAGVGSAAGFACRWLLYEKRYGA